MSKTLQARVHSLEAQINAMAQAWLYLTANLEMQAGIDMQAMQAAMQQKYWPDNPALNAEARHTINWLCGEMDSARERRQWLAAKRTRNTSRQQS